jgi:hypothetical protein
MAKDSWKLTPLAVNNKGKTIINLAAGSPSARKMLLDSSLLDRGLVNPREVYQRMRGQTADHSNMGLDPNIGRVRNFGHETASTEVGGVQMHGS